MKHITLTYPYVWLLALAVLNGHPGYVTLEEIITAESEEVS